jgi:hypothetical protein
MVLDLILIPSASFNRAPSPVTTRQLTLIVTQISRMETQKVFFIYNLNQQSEFTFYKLML